MLFTNMVNNLTIQQSTHKKPPGAYINTHFSMSYTVNTTTGASSTKNYADMDLPGQGELHLSHCTVARAFACMHA